MPIASLAFEALSASARLAMPYIQSMVESGLSTTAIQQTLSASGMGVRRTDLLAAVRSVKGVLDTRPYVDALRLDVMPNPDRLSAPATAQLRQYSYKVKVKGALIETGQAMEQYITISTNDLMSKADAVSAAMDVVDTNMNTYGISSHSAQVVDITAAS